MNIDKLEIMNREVSQNQHTHGFLRSQTKTSFMHFTKHNLQPILQKKKERVENATCEKKTNKTTALKVI